MSIRQLISSQDTITSFLHLADGLLTFKLVCGMSAVSRSLAADPVDLLFLFTTGSPRAGLLGLWIYAVTTTSFRMKSAWEVVAAAVTGFISRHKHQSLHYQ